ncbi:MAG TPA: rhodanese-like domain-containing protein [Paludibacter sp.]|nr:rhodanese-like domain-containing protein [Paludibacter sp.]
MFESLKKLLGIEPKVSLIDLVNEGAVILDVRTKGEFTQGHIRGSINIPVENLSSNLNKFKGKSKPIITCCASGSRSAYAKGILTSNGFTNVHNGGAWISLKRKISIN